MSGFIVELPTAGASPQRLIAAGVRDANRAWRTGRDRYIENVLEIARHVHAVWQECERAKVSFRSLFKDGAETAFEFSRDDANKFLAIAKNQTLVAGGAHVHQALPRDIVTLSKLAHVPAPKLKKLIETETITPNMRRAEVAALVNNASPTPSKQTQRRVFFLDLNKCPDSEVASAVLVMLSYAWKGLPKEERLQTVTGFVKACGLEEILK